MNKKLIAVGIAAVLAAPFAAQAGVEVYGEARASVDFVNNNDPVTTNKDSKMSLSSNTSYLGFRGDEDLGNGLTAMWQYETGVQVDTGTFNTANVDSQTFVGLGGGFGTVLAGKLNTPYTSSTQSLDIFANTIADYNAVMGFGHDLLTNNTIAYVTPDMNGFHAAVGYVASSIPSGDNLPLSSVQNDQDAYSVSGNYMNGPLSVVAAYESLNKLGSGAGASGAKDATAMKIGGSYTIMDATTIGLIYENTDVGGTVKDRNAYYLNVAHKMGDTTLKLAYGNIDKCGGTTANCDKTGASQLAVGVSQALSKNTDVYALYTSLSNDDNAGFGLISDTGLGSSPVTGKDMSAFSIGINHAFSSK